MHTSQSLSYFQDLMSLSFYFWGPETSLKYLASFSLFSSTEPFDRNLLYYHLWKNLWLASNINSGSEKIYWEHYTLKELIFSQVLYFRGCK